MVQSDAELIRRGILLIEHLADLVQPLQTCHEIPALAEERGQYLEKCRNRLERILWAANSIED